MLLPRGAPGVEGPFRGVPSLLATWGPGARSDAHAHHAVQLILALDGELQVNDGSAAPSTAGGVLVASDAAHAVDAAGRAVLILFVDPESEQGAALARTIAGNVRLLHSATLTRLRALVAPRLENGSAWAAIPDVLRELGADVGVRKRVHPAVRRALAIIQSLPAEDAVSLEALALRVGLSPSRLQHAFRADVGLPLRPYVLWTRLLAAAGAILAGEPLTAAALHAGFADAAHMTRTFRRMFGVAPSELRRATRGAHAAHS